MTREEYLKKYDTTEVFVDSPEELHLVEIQHEMHCVKTAVKKILSEIEILEDMLNRKEK